MLNLVWRRAGAVVAKYGDKSVYFDLEDLGNTTGQWDLYGSDAPSPYNSLQVCLITKSIAYCHCVDKNSNDSVLNKQIFE